MSEESPSGSDLEEMHVMDGIRNRDEIDRRGIKGQRKRNAEKKYDF